MNRTLLFTLTQVALAGCAVYLAVLVNLPPVGYAGLAVLFATTVAAQLAPEGCVRFWPWAWVGTLPALAALLNKVWVADRDNYYGLLAAEVALVVFISANRPGAARFKSRWNLLGIVWGFAAAMIGLVLSYLENLAGEFCLALAGCLFMLILCRFCFRLRPIGIQTVNTLMLLLVALPAADFCLRLRARHDMNLDPAKYYSYEAGRKHPAANSFWARYYSEQWVQMWRQVAMYDTTNRNIYRLRPDTHAYFFRSLVSVNHKGYRGPEIPDEKGNAYRIVALGESTTFGVTMDADDRPWPELLEQMIRERLHPARPVQVINAGIPAATLPGNINRLSHEILALKPDMIISYHGFNGFYMLYRELPPIAAKPPPGYEPRPLKLLADLEYGIKLSRYKKALIPHPIRDTGSSVSPMDSHYAEAYRKLIQLTETQGIQLVLANYSMAVNAPSDPALIAFYEQTSPATRLDIRANEAHSEIVRELAKEHPDICFVNTQARVDGKDENFIDLVHFTRAGDRQMAEVFFDGIRSNLEAALGGNATATAK